MPLSSEALAVLAAQRERLPAGIHYVFPTRQTWRGGWRWRDRRRAGNCWLRALHPIQAAVPKFHELPGKCTGRGWHLFRHTFASRLVQAGVSLYKVAEWMGHSDVRTTRIYAHLAQGYDTDIERASL